MLEKDEMRDNESNLDSTGNLLVFKVPKNTSPGSGVAINLGLLGENYG